MPPIVLMKSRRLKHPSLSLRDHYQFRHQNRKVRQVKPWMGAAMCAAQNSAGHVQSGQKPRRRSGPGVGLCPQYLPSRRNFMHRGERRQVPRADLGQTYSITSSARNKVAVGSVIPIAFAVFRLIANSKRSGCSTGRSAGFAPRKIFATNEAPRRITQAKSTP
jgi:hypothetical protein